MKRVILFTLSLALWGTISAQNEIVLNIDHQFNGEPLVGGQAFATNDGYNVDIDRMQYYLSELQITHDGGQVTLIEDTWLLVDALEAGTTEVSLGEYDINYIEAIKFGIGVDAAHNHLDPASWPSDHPLNYQTPSMHWGWSPGYRFVCLEGNTGGGENLFITYEIHGLGDENYSYATIWTGAYADSNVRTIPLVANYGNCFSNCDVSSGVIEHSTENEAAQLLINMRAQVFSSSLATSVEEVAAGSFTVMPNPTTDGQVTIQLGSDQYNRLVVRDLTGRVILSENLVARNNIELSLPQSGIYIASLFEGNEVVDTRKIVVSH